MLPLAVNLWAQKKGDLWLEQLARSGQKKRCVFYKPRANDPKKGRCLVYAFRPLICRLFGFSFHKDKNGNLIYGGCKIIKKAYPRTVTRIKKILAKKPHLHKITDFSIRLFGLGTLTDQKLIPINHAAKNALEKIGFILEKQKTPCKM